MVPPNNLGHDLANKLVNETMQRGMIRISKYLKVTPSLSLWYLKCSRFDFTGYSDSDYAGCNMDRESTSVLYQNYLREFWYTAVVEDPNPSEDDSEARLLKELIIHFTVKNGKKSLTIDFKTFVESIGLDYNQGTYVAHPSLEVAKAELAKIATTEALVLGGNYSFIEYMNSIQQLIAYCLLTGTKVDIGEIIYNDLVTRLMAKSRHNYVSYPRFVSCALEVLQGLEYAQEDKFGSLPNVLSPSKFTRDPSKVTFIELTTSMVAINNLESVVTPLPFLETKKKKRKSQTMSQPTPKTQGPKASGALPQKKKKPLSSPPLRPLQHHLLKRCQQRILIKPNQSPRAKLLILKIQREIYNPLLGDSILHSIRALANQSLCLRVN
nr:hypothetical protein [Tanacetum cinerariifolium]